MTFRFDKRVHVHTQRSRVVHHLVRPLWYVTWYAFLYE